MLTRLDCWLTNGRFSPWDKSDQGTREHTSALAVKILTLGKVFVGLPSGRKTTYVCAVPAVSEIASSYAPRKIPFYYLELAKGLEPPTL
jgi:hypothetical protein